jgi:3-hydroxyacyl-[acyl-carrier-protein] dehydratase
MPTKNLPESAQRFVLHRPPILMLRELTACDGLCAEGTACIPKASPFQSMGALPRCFFVELLAQLIAAAQGYREIEARTNPSGGYLVGVQNFECCGDAYEGDSLNLYIRRMNQVEGMNISEGKVIRADKLIALGELRCFFAPSVDHPSPAGVVSWGTGWSSLDDTISRCTEIVFLDTAAGKAEADICFVPNAPVFAGHFPDRPLVPGVVLLETGLVLARKLLSQQITFRKIVSARFKKPIEPEDIAKIEVSIKSGPTETFLFSRITSGKTLAATFELALEST